MTYGICHLSLIPVRKVDSDKSELVSQLVFGEVYCILEEKGKWVFIQIAFDGYQGWIDKAQSMPVSEEFAQKVLKEANQAISLDLCSILENGSQKFPILRGSSLPLLQEERIDLGKEQFRFTGKFRRMDTLLSGDELLEIAFSYLKTPYLWGGKGPFGIDCSGFTQQVFKTGGFRLKRDAYQQAAQGREVALEKTQSADLAFFERENRIVHVGIVIDKNFQNLILPALELEAGQHYIIHALECVRIDLLDQQGILNIDRQIYTHQLSHLQRIVSA